MLQAIVPMLSILIYHPFVFSSFFSFFSHPSLFSTYLIPLFLLPFVARKP